MWLATIGPDTGAIFFISYRLVDFFTSTYDI